jgi:hypothetical protein
MSSDWESQSEGFFSSLGHRWNESKQKTAEGVTLGHLAEQGLFPIHDPDLLRASEDFFAALAIFAPVSEQVEVWQKALVAVSSSVGATAESWRGLFQTDPRFGRAVPAFSQSAAALAAGAEAITKTELPRFRVQFIVPMKSEFDRIDSLRSRAHKLTYKVEQLQLAVEDATLKKVIDKTKPEWLDQARADLAVAKPVFFTALTEFLGRFESWKVAARTDFDGIRGKLLGPLGQVPEQQLPPQGSVQYEELDVLLTIGKKKGAAKSA